MILTSSILTKICRELEDPRSDPEDEREYSTDQLLDWLYDGYCLLLSLIAENDPAMVWRKDTIAIEAETGVKNDIGFIPLMVLKAWYDDGSYWLDKLQLRDRNDLDPDQQGAPVYFYVEGEKGIAIHPIPDEAVSIKLWSIQDPGVLAYDSATGTDTEIDLPKSYERYLKEYVILRARNRGEASVDLEASFLQTWRSDILIRLEKRTGALLTAVPDYVSD